MPGDGGQNTSDMIHVERLMYRCVESFDTISNHTEDVFGSLRLMFFHRDRKASQFPLSVFTHALCCVCDRAATCVCLLYVYRGLET